MISVIMPVFNTKQYLEQAIESVLYQGVASPEASARFYYDQSSIFSIGLWILCMCEGSISIYNGKNCCLEKIHLLFGLLGRLSLYARGSLTACHGRNVRRLIILRKRKNFCFGFLLQRI